MLIHFSGTAAAAHADIFDRAAKAGGLVPLKVAQADENIRIHHRAANARHLAIFCARHRHLHFVGALEAIANDHLTAGGGGVKAIDGRTFQMVQRIFAAARIQGVAVHQKGLAAQALYFVGHGAGIGRAQIA